MKQKELPMSQDRLWFLLTATVRPNLTKKLAVVDPSVRLRQYQEALRSWVEVAREQDAHIAIVETSGFERAAFLAAVDASDQGRITFVNYEPSAAVIGRGIGYIEWQAIRFALETVGFHADDTVYKVTGRLTVTNPKAVFGRLEPNGVRLRTRIDGSHSDTRVLGASVAVWRDVLLPAADDVDYDRRIEIEHTVAARVRHARTLGRVSVSSFPRRPRFAGQSGTNGATYSPWKVAVQGAVVRPWEPVIAIAARSISR
jgi:hypothetical protein